MIVGMTKYTFLIYHKEYETFLEQMREIGVLHVIQKQSGAPEEGSQLQEKIALAQRYEKALKEINNHLSGDFAKCQPERTGEDAISLIAEMESLNEKKTKLALHQIALEKEIDRVGPWGDFTWDSVNKLRDAGFIIRFWSCSERNFDQEWIEKYNAVKINNAGSAVLFVTITREGEEVEPDNCEEVRLPDETLQELKDARERCIQAQYDNHRALEKFYLDNFFTLDASYRKALEAIDYQHVVLSTEGAAENSVYLLEGWVPTENVQTVNDFLDLNGYYYEQHKAEKDDKAPVLLKNNKFAKLFHPITELYDLPAYGEMDLTPFFAPFFVMFFGLCLGDAGYGLLLIAAGLFAHHKVKPSLKPMMTLVTILGCGTVVFGFMSGTLFGIQLLKVDWPWIQAVKGFMLDSNKLFYFALGIGVVQILFGMFLKAIGQTKRFGIKSSLASWGWFILIFGCGTVYALSYFKMIAPEVAHILYYVFGGLGVVGIFILNNLKRNPIINIGAGVWDSYNMASGLLGDVLSYVRLFALGISGSVLGLVFNDLAEKMSPDIPVLGFIVSAIILLFGHGINLFMNGLGAFVHPMRLTFVEFYKNAGFEGGGKKYNPFKRRLKEE